MVRYLALFPAAVGITFCLFMLMAQLAGINRKAPDVTDTPVVSMGRILIDNPIEARERQRPPPPEELIQQPQVPQPQISMKSITEIKMTTPDIRVSNSVSPVSIDVQPGNLTMATGFSGLSAASSVVMAAPLSRIDPRYPLRAQRRRIEGFVKVQFQVSEQGKVVPGSFTIIESEPKGVFESSVKRALLRWRFPPQPDGAYLTAQTLEFKMEQ